MLRANRGEACSPLCPVQPVVQVTRLLAARSSPRVTRGCPSACPCWTPGFTLLSTAGPAPVRPSGSTPRTGDQTHIYFCFLMVKSQFILTRIETQLDLAATSFLSQEVIIEKKENGSFEVNVSKLLQWYGSDFGDSPTDVLTWIIKRLASDKFHLDEIVKSGFQIIFRDYDWASNLLGEKRPL